MLHFYQIGIHWICLGVQWHRPNTVSTTPRTQLCRVPACHREIKLVFVEDEVSCRSVRCRPLSFLCKFLNNYGGGGCPTRLSEFAGRYFWLLVCVRLLRRGCVGSLSTHWVGSEEIGFKRLQEVGNVLGKSGTNVKLLTSEAFALWCPSHASASILRTKSFQLLWFHHQTLPIGGAKCCALSPPHTHTLLLGGSSMGTQDTPPPYFEGGELKETSSRKNLDGKGWFLGRAKKLEGLKLGGDIIDDRILSKLLKKNITPKNCPPLPFSPPKPWKSETFSNLFFIFISHGHF